MLITPSRSNLNTIVVLNPKGGCGKTTVATNIAAYYAGRGPMPAIMDCDPQGSTMSWLEKRSPKRPPIYGIAAFKKTAHQTRSWQLRVPNETTHLIIDSPASIARGSLCELVHDATSILVPVLPSPIDIHAASRCIADLLLIAKIDRRDRKLAVVANRTRSNTRSFEKLMRFLDSLGIPIISVLRDSQNYVQATEEGLGIADLQPYRVKKDLGEIEKITTWLDAWPSRRRKPKAPSITATHTTSVAATHLRSA